MHPNFYFFIKKGEMETAKTQVLDFGCGIGSFVDHLRQLDIQAFGADTFQDYYSDWSVKIPDSVKPYVKKIEHGSIPYPDNHFDICFSNQVFEHIQEYADSLQEIKRILKPGGRLIFIYPDKGVIREPHIGVPFVHLMEKNSFTQKIYLTLCFYLRIGRKFHMGIEGWKNVITNVTFYHDRTKFKLDVEKLFGSALLDLSHEYFDFRIQSSQNTLSKLASPLIPKFLKRVLVWKLSGSVYQVIKK